MLACTLRMINEKLKFQSVTRTTEQWVNEEKKMNSCGKNCDSKMSWKPLAANHIDMDMCQGKFLGLRIKDYC